MMEVESEKLLIFLPRPGPAHDCSCSLDCVFFSPKLPDLVFPSVSCKTGAHLTINILFQCNRKLSLNYLQLNASGIRSSRDDGRRRKSRRRADEMAYDDTDSTYGQPLSKNDINAIRRSQVCTCCFARAKTSLCLLSTHSPDLCLYF